MKVLPPLTMMSSPSGVNFVAMPVASDPAFGSVMHSDASAPSASFGRNRFFWSSVPKSMTGFMAWKLVAQMIPVAAQALLISRTQTR